MGARLQVCSENCPQEFRRAGTWLAVISVGDSLDTHGVISFVPETMADKDDKWENNVAGKFYVDQQCIDCDLCRETAPDFFTRHDDGGYSFVHKQPTTEEDISLCMEALEGCPVEAIGEDGDT